MTEPNQQLTKTHGFNPISHHWVKRDGPVWLRLVKAGLAKDPELEQKIADKAMERGRLQEEKKTVKKLPTSSVAKAKAVRAARKMVANNRSELDDLESDAVDEKLSKVMAKRLALGDATSTEAPSSDSEDESEPTPRKPPKLAKPGGKTGPVTTRVRLKSMPIPVPARKSTSDRLAALRQSLSLPIESEEDS